MEEKLIVFIYGICEKVQTKYRLAKNSKVKYATI